MNSVADIWDNVLTQLKRDLSETTIATWFDELEAVALRENTFYLHCSNDFKKGYIEDLFLTNIKAALHDLFSIDIGVAVLNDEEFAALSGKEPARRDNFTPAGEFTFETFVVGPSNKLAYAASASVAEHPAKNYNPLFIYGDSGLGKTHLIYAIANVIRKRDHNARIAYVKGDDLTNELVNAIREGKTAEMREKYRQADLLLVDDVQFIAGKKQTQEEFFHTFNTLHDSGKQIVVTSDKFPKDIPNLEGRLRSRFEWGLIADIQPPEIETKVAIVDKKAQENNISLPKNVAYYIASKAESNIRELEGFIIRIGAYASLTGREIDMDLVKEVLKKFFKQGEKPEVTVDEIMKTVAAKFNIRIADLKSQKKNKNLVIPRQIAMYLARKLTSHSFPDIGAKIGGKDHSTVIYANNKIKDLLEKDPKIEVAVKEIEETLNRS